jgi:hypothetical protein
LTFAPGERFKQVTVDTLRDFAPDGDNGFFLDVVGASANALALSARGSGWIYDMETWGGYGDLYGGW